jgi:hypothetical protein
VERLGFSVSGAEGYHLFTDTYYSSVQLAQELDNQKCRTTVTIIAGRVCNPKPVRQGAMKKMKNGDTCAYRSGSVLLMSWRDKRVVLMMSTYCEPSMGKNGDHSERGGTERNSKDNVCT